MSVSNFYFLNDDKSTSPCTQEEWSKQMRELSIKNTKHVAESKIDNYRISTVFLGINHSFYSSCSPKIFETMIFEGDSYHDIYMRRYSTWEEAEKGHQDAIKWLKEALLPW